MPSGRIQDKIALVTGAGSGIGQATASLLAQEGAKVVVTDVDAGAAQTVAEQIQRLGGTALALRLDVAQENEWKMAIQTVLDKFARFDVLVNNAGVAFVKPIKSMTLAEWKTVLAVNLDGVFLGTKYAMQTMKPQGNGSIVNVASVSGIKPAGRASAYCASKAAVRIFSKTAAIECADAQSGIRVNLVTPGGVKTPIWTEMPFFQELLKQHSSAEQAFAAIEGPEPSKQFFTPEQVAESILYLASDESAHVSGTEVILDRGHTG